MASAATPTSILGKVIRFFFGLVLLTLIGLTMLPVMFNIAILKGASGTLPDWLIDGISVVLAFILSLTPFGSTGFPVVDLASSAVYQREQILARRTTADPSGRIRQVRFIGVSFVDRNASINLAKGEGVSAQTAVHLGARPDRAIVFITNDHVRWSFTGAGPVGFHGAAPLEIRTPPGGLMAELRLYETTGDRVSGSLNAINAPDGIRTNFCSAIASWRSHYRLDHDDIDYVELTMPRSILISDNSAMADGRFGNYFSGQTLKRLCR